MNASDLFPSNYVCHADLKGKPRKVQIKTLVQEEVFNTRANRKEPRWVIYFHKATKGLILNKGMSDVLSQAYGEEDVDRAWINQWVELYPTQDRIQGTMTDVVRLRAPQAAQAPPSPGPEPPTQDEPPQDAHLEIDGDQAGLSALADIGLVVMEDFGKVAYTLFVLAVLEQTPGAQRLEDITPEQMPAAIGAAKVFLRQKQDEATV